MLDHTTCVRGGRHGCEPPPLPRGSSSVWVVPSLKPAVGNSSPFLTNLPFHDFPNYFNHESWFTILCSPNEDFGPSKNMWVRAFVSTFHTPSALFGLRVMKNALPTYLSTVQNLRLGSIKFLQNVLPTYFSTVQNLRLGSIKFFENTFPKVN